ncbi:MAG TPA: UDP-glucose/GDP-mannose dehydrogenase family protein [Candidatus Binataceae bacterium]|nr:UDP-glucose/GDP-mannose dehydrogenase family protein [Candidatus Binataceae bacterium]
MNIAIIGTGYVGLVTGTCFAEGGNEVVCVDIDRARIAGLRAGEVPFYEPGLQELVRRNQREGRLSFMTELVPAVRQSMITFITVGTPMDSSGAADLSAVMAVAQEVGAAIQGYHIVAVKSTVPIGTGDKVEALVRSHTSAHFDVCSVPEFLKEGSAIEDFTRPDRVIIGSQSDRATAILKELHEPFVRTDNPILVMDRRSAELCKYACNSMLALRISFINEIANLCEAAGAEISHVRRGLSSDRRIGSHFLFPGIGYGGSCFPKDVQALIHTASEYEQEFSLLKAAEEVNRRQKTLLVDRIKAHFGHDLSGRTLAVWGLAFKPRTDDMREAPSITIIEGLLAAGATIAAHDPEAMDNARRIFGERITYHTINYDALRGADALLVLTEWNEFRQPNFNRLRELLKQPVIFDGRNLYDPALMRALNFTYYSVGRHPI